MKSSVDEYLLRPAALADIDGIVEYLRDARDPFVAIRFIEAAQATFEHLTFAPNAYPEFKTTNQRLEGLRWRPLTGSFDRYLVFYRLDEQGRVEVMRVVHGSQDLRRVLDAD